MKKIVSIALATTLALASVSAMACPKGTTLTGGVGKNHKGGSCVPKSGVVATPKAPKAPKAPRVKKVKAAAAAPAAPAEATPAPVPAAKK